MLGPKEALNIVSEWLIEIGGIPALDLRYGTFM